MNLTFRLAEPRDDAFVGELLVDSFISAYGRIRPDLDVPDSRRDDLRSVAKRRTDSSVWVAMNESEKIVGTYTIKSWVQPELDPSSILKKTSELTLLATDSKLQGSGIGKTLMGHAISSSAGEGYERMVLHVREGIEGLDRFYRSFGFTRNPSIDKKVYERISLYGYERLLP